MKLRPMGCGHCGATFYAASNQETCSCGSGPNILGTEKSYKKGDWIDKTILVVVCGLTLISEGLKYFVFKT